MELKVINKKQDPLLFRTEIKAEMYFKGATPSKEEVKKKISSQVSANESLVVVRNIYTRQGVEQADVEAYVYDNADKMKVIEPKKSKLSKKEQEAAKPKEEKAAAPAEAPKEEKKAEEKPAEKKEDKKGE